ncbi:hypothetical protein ABZT17_30370 [Streptomyces sp. NPDC005648]|uniref:hypothetical protein n=1 Tax=Streptomyces sp. NPDC005648 TaxID=3157044 RepID=UPI0033A9FBBF
MHSRGRTLRFAAVTGFVVLSLTGFATGRHHGIGKHHSGGGCSSSSQDHDTSSHTTTTTTTGGGGSTPSASPAMAVLLSCATVKQPYTTVEVSNPNGTAGTFEVTVNFDDEGGHLLSVAHPKVEVPANGTETVRVDAGAALLKHLDHCDVRDLAPAAG